MNIIYNTCIISSATITIGLLTIVILLGLVVLYSALIELIKK